VSYVTCSLTFVCINLGLSIVILRSHSVNFSAGTVKHLYDKECSRT
jgi:hypothetical protein